MVALLQAIDFVFWTLIPAVMLLMIIAGLPAALVLGVMLTGRAREERRPQASSLNS